MRDKIDIDLYFGLSYTNYLILHRSILQSMPLDWQHRFTELMGEVEDAMGPVMREKMPSRYDIRILAREPQRITEYETCYDCEGEGEVMQANGDGGVHTERWIICPTCEGEQELEGEERWETPEEVGIIDDPVPHYNRTRTQLDFETGEEIRYCGRCEGRHAFSRACA